ncbi:MAG: riboflavin synthase [Deltaproteobacteria bacterium]|nr:MAG: riboflavin synthase [Deltaproteobacteria bacterium]
MFTGIVEDIGRVIRTERVAAGALLQVESSLDPASMKPGDSVAVNGACLTVTRIVNGTLSFDVGPETLRATTLGRIGPGHRVHLERALRVGGRLGGHLVTGHVDGVGRLLRRRPVGNNLELEFEAPPEVVPYLVPKGSVAVDGVSLTVNSPSGGRFSVTLVPHTLERTLLGRLREGDRVNLEGDIIGKYVRHFVPGGGGITEDFLSEHGFL